MNIKLLDRITRLFPSVADQTEQTRDEKQRRWQQQIWDKSAAQGQKLHQRELAAHKMRLANNALVDRERREREQLHAAVQAIINNAEEATALRLKIRLHDFTKRTRLELSELTLSADDLARITKRMAALEKSESDHEREIETGAKTLAKLQEQIRAHRADMVAGGIVLPD